MEPTKRQQAAIKRLLNSKLVDELYDIAEMEAQTDEFANEQNLEDAQNQYEQEVIKVVDWFIQELNQSVAILRR